MSAATEFTDRLREIRDEIIALNDAVGASVKEGATTPEEAADWFEQFKSELTFDLPEVALAAGDPGVRRCRCGNVYRADWGHCPQCCTCGAHQ